MLISMTSFSQFQSEHHEGMFTCELRSVNHRFLELSFNLPDELKSLETQFRQKIKENVSRGKIDCFLRFIPHLKQSIRVQEQSILDYKKKENLLLEYFPHATSLSLSDLINNPNFFQQVEYSVEQNLKHAHDLFEKTLSAFIEDRKEEGRVLEKLVMSRLLSLESLLKKINNMGYDIPGIKRAELMKKLEEHDIPQVDSGRFEQEVVYFLNKLDISEETERLSVFIQESIHLMESDVEVLGRRLNFILQELNREVNTILSKSSLVGISKAALDMKLIIEQIREQIQNVE